MTGFIAEVSSNHACDLDRSLAFIDKAAEIGCSAVKFQLFKIDRMFAPEILTVSEMHRKRREWELPESFLPELAKRCRDRGVQFSCTPFDLEAVAILEPYVDFYKVASYELLWHDLLDACGRTGKPVLLSTGMATMKEIHEAVSCLKKAGCKEYALLHCVSGYPAPAEECNLGALQKMREAFDCPVGWSDHSVDPAVVCRAVHRFEATTVEFHLDLEGEGAEYAAGHCWLPEAIAPVIRACRQPTGVDGNGVKAPVPAELPDREWRADPMDGLRPLKSVRAHWVQKLGELE